MLNSTKKREKHLQRLRTKASNADVSLSTFENPAVGGGEGHNPDMYADVDDGRSANNPVYSATGVQDIGGAFRAKLVAKEEDFE